MDLTITTETFGQEDQSWLGSEHGTSSCRTVTLDMSLFAAGLYAGGYLPSGICLAKVTATGKYGPYTSGASNGLQTAVGYLFTSQKVKTASSQIAAPIFEHGRVVLSKLPVQSGAGYPDSTAQTALKLVNHV